MEESTVSEGKTTAIVSYITLIGFIIALIMNNDKKNAFASFHIRQSLGIILLAIVSSIISFIPVIGWFVGLAVFVFWLMGLIYAIQGKAKEVPLLGEHFQTWFKSV